MVVMHETARRGRGRPLDHSRDEAIIEATLAGLSEVGYDRLTMEMVAGRARVGKATLYRRWSSKADLVADALAALKSHPLPPDTGSLRGDLEALLAEDPSPSDPNVGPLVCGLMTAASRDPALSEVLQERFVEPRKQLLRTVVERAVARGEVQGGRDLEMVIQVVPAFMYSRAVLDGEVVGPQLLGRVIRELVYPLLAAGPSALWDGAGPGQS